MPEIPLTRRYAVLLAFVLVVLLALVGKRLAGAGAAQAPRPASAFTPVAAAAGTAKIVVHVVGAVRRPGLYRLPDGARVADAVARAGGAARRAELTGVNLAAPLADGAQVVVPARIAVIAAGAAAAPVGVGAGKVSLATATVEQLDELPGVGPVTAQKIVDWRTAHGPFRTVDDLDQVPGIGPTRIEQLRELVTP